MRALAAGLGGLGVLGAVMWLGMAAAPAGAPVPSPEAGAELSARWCAACHVVSASGAGGDSAPGFPAIARRLSAPEVRAALAEHQAAPMRGFSLTPREAADVAAYMETLRRK